MQGKVDTVWEWQGWPPALGEYLRFTLVLTSDECLPAYLASQGAAYLASLIPVPGVQQLVMAQWQFTANEILNKNEGLGVTVRIFCPIAAIGIAYNEVEPNRFKSDTVPGPFSDLSVEVSDKGIYEKVTPDGWYRVLVDLNRGAGGKFLYLKCKPYEPSDGNPISELTILSSDKDNITTPAGFTKVATDLNKSVGGDFIYLYYKKGPAPIEGIAVVAAASSEVQAPERFVKINVDLNKHAGGQFIYLCFQSAGTAAAIVQAEVRRNAYVLWQQRKRPTGDPWTDWFRSEKMTETRRIANLHWQQRGRPTGDDWTDWFVAEKTLEELARTRATPEPRSVPEPKPLQAVRAAA
jgi:hypothetical protein